MILDKYKTHEIQMVEGLSTCTVSHGQYLAVAEVFLRTKAVLPNQKGKFLSIGGTCQIVGKKDR